MDTAATNPVANNSRAIASQKTSRMRLCPGHMLTAASRPTATTTKKATTLIATVERAGVGWSAVPGSDEVTGSVST